MVIDYNDSFTLANCKRFYIDIIKSNLVDIRGYCSPQSQFHLPAYYNLVPHLQARVQRMTLIEMLFLLHMKHCIVSILTMR